jgi:hypothetical protein
MHPLISGDYLAYFPGGVPAGVGFRLQVDNIRELMSAFEGRSIYNDPSVEVCFIALIAYVEGFFKGLFASLVNICPMILQELRAANYPLTIDASELIPFGAAADRALGFVLAESSSMNTPRDVNRAFGALLKVTPFSVRDGKIYEGYLADRNLLVHHGGNLTAKYIRQKGLGAGERERVYLDSLALERAEVLKRLDFIEKLVVKALGATKRALTAFVDDHKPEMDQERLKALDAIDWYPYS